MKPFVMMTAFFGITQAQGCAQQPGKTNEITYVALGDSYTICEGASASESWPVLLANHLTAKNIPVTLAANPARTGYTTSDLIKHELPVLARHNAGFVTLCIGVNDWVRGVDETTFAQNLEYIVNHVLKRLNNKTHLILLTIPDFSLTPQGAKYTGGRNATQGIKNFNAIIEKTAARHHLAIVDLFDVSNAMGGDATLVARDGLHPSARQYAIWETLVLPVAEKILRQ